MFNTRALLAAFCLFSFPLEASSQESNATSGDNSPVIQNENGNVTIIYNNDNPNGAQTTVPESLRPELSDIAGSTWEGMMPVTDYIIRIDFDREFVDRLGTIQYRSRSRNGAVMCSGTLRLNSYRPMFTSGTYRMEQFIDDEIGFPCISNIFISAMQAGELLNVSVTDRTSGRTIAGIIQQW